MQKNLRTKFMLYSQEPTNTQGSRHKGIKYIYIHAPQKRINPQDGSGPVGPFQQGPFRHGAPWADLHITVGRSGTAGLMETFFLAPRPFKLLPKKKKDLSSMHPGRLTCQSLASLDNTSPLRNQVLYRERMELNLYLARAIIGLGWSINHLGKLCYGLCVGCFQSQLQPGLGPSEFPFEFCCHMLPCHLWFSWVVFVADISATRWTYT